MNRFLVSAMLLLGLLCFSWAATAQTRTIEIDATRATGPLNTFFKTSVGAGRANEGLRADWQRQLAEVRRELGFRYIRMHGLLEDDMGVYKIDERGRERYNFQYIDELYDFILDIGMKPFVELSFMPTAMASGDKTIFWWRGNVTPPADHDRWERLIRALAAHWTERYGAAEVATWYFEVWNEPNLDGFWAGSQDDYFKLYTHAAKAIKSVNPSYRVGGPATAGAAWIPEMIAYCSDNKVPLDFVSTHSYGVRQGHLDEFGTTGTVLAEDEFAVSGDVLDNRRQISESPVPDLELHFTEWSSSYTPSDPIHDSYHEAAYILQKLKQVGDSVQSMSYWTFTDIFEEAGPRFEAFHGGFGLLNVHGIKKPAWFSYRFLNRLGGTELENQDAMSWATTDGRGGVQVLLWDFSHTLPEGINNQQYYAQDLPAAAKGHADIRISGLQPGDYALRVSQVGYMKNDAYTAWLAMGAPAQLTRDQVEALEGTASGAPSSEEIIRIDADGRYDARLSLRENDVFLIELIRN